MRKRWTLISFAGVLLVIAGASESGRWRLDVLRLKLTGELPMFSWTEVFSGLRLCSWGPCHRSLIVGEVAFAEFDANNPCPVLWNTPSGPMRGLIEDRSVLEHFLTRSWIAHPESPRVQPGDIVLEIGAWLGAFTRSALDQGASLVVAFEPEPINRSCFEQNFADEIEQGRVVVIAAAAWDRAGRVKLANVGPLNAEGSRKGFAVANDGPIEADSVTIDETVERLELERVNFINMDIEGGELYALRGALRTIQRFHPVIVSCIHHLPGDRKRIPESVLEMESRYDLQMTDLQGFFRPIREVRPE